MRLITLSELSEVRHARATWQCGWFVAWTRLRARRAYWERHRPPEQTACAEGGLRGDGALLHRGPSRR